MKPGDRVRNKHDHEMTGTIALGQTICVQWDLPPGRKIHSYSDMDPADMELIPFEEQAPAAWVPRVGSKVVWSRTGLPDEVCEAVKLAGITENPLVICRLRGQEYGVHLGELRPAPPEASPVLTPDERTADHVKRWGGALAEMAKGPEPEASPGEPAPATPPPEHWLECTDRDHAGPCTIDRLSRRERLGREAFESFFDGRGARPTQWEQIAEFNRELWRVAGTRLYDLGWREGQVAGQCQGREQAAFEAESQANVDEGRDGIDPVKSELSPLGMAAFALRNMAAQLREGPDAWIGWPATEDQIRNVESRGYRAAEAELDVRLRNLQEYADRTCTAEMELAANQAELARLREVELHAWRIIELSQDRTPGAWRKHLDALRTALAPARGKEGA